MITRNLTIGLAAAALLGILEPAWGYNVGQARWPQNATSFDAKLGDGSDDSMFEAAYADAAAAWGAKTAFRFDLHHRSADPCGLPTNGRYRNGIAFAETRCGGAEFNSHTLALTLNWSIDGELVQSGIVFNARHHLWDVYDGPWQHGVADFRRVAAHELGHAAGLHHESHQPALMAPIAGDILVPQPDDAAGVEALYRLPELLSSSFEGTPGRPKSTAEPQRLDEFTQLSADIEGDGLDDTLRYRPIDGLWQLQSAATGEVRRVRLGGPGQQPLTGDFDGDGRADIATWAPATGLWQLWLEGAREPQRLRLGVRDGEAAVGDRDGDGRDELLIGSGETIRAFHWPGAPN